MKILHDHPFKSKWKLRVKNDVVQSGYNCIWYGSDWKDKDDKHRYDMSLLEFEMVMQDVFAGKLKFEDGYIKGIWTFQKQGTVIYLYRYPVQKPTYHYQRPDEDDD